MSPTSPTSGHAYRRHLARTSRGRNFTQPGAQAPNATTTPVPHAAPVVARAPPTQLQHTLDQGAVVLGGEDEEDMDDTRDSDDEDEEEEGAEGEDVTEEIDGAEGDGEGAIEEGK